jgi:para-nitrobenzyl esterase
MRPTALIVACAFVALPLTGAIRQPVKLTSGLVSGVSGKDAAIAVFKGIPFAAPPIGNLRWRPPQAAASWQGVRKADQFGNSCVQTIKADNKPWTYEFMTHNEVSEDCLNLNVWTGAKAGGEGRPVYVYIYGGANTEGSSAVPAYDGEGLAKKGIVVVTVNYRLGVFGFFAHPELSKDAEYKSSGNYALLDLIAALHWVHDNIAAFGGDPAKVTIGGQSAGGANTQSLIVSPLAKGLFRGAIIESAGGASRPLAEQEQAGVKFAEVKGAASLADLRRMPWKDLLTSTPGAPRFSTAVLDGYVLPANAADPFEQSAVPILTGINMHEGGAVPHPDVTPDGFAEQVRRRYQDAADEVLKLYPAAAQNELAWDAARLNLYLRAKAAKTSVYTYFWDHTLPGPDAAKYGAFHSSEIPYVFSSLATADRPFTAADHQIADRMSSYWANFIATGDPNGKGLPHWASIAEKPGFTMEVGDRNAPIPVAGSDGRRQLLEKVFAARR